MSVAGSNTFESGATRPIPLRRALIAFVLPEKSTRNLRQLVDTES
jgi:hypothetical protein